VAITLPSANLLVSLVRAGKIDLSRVLTFGMLDLSFHRSALERTAGVDLGSGPETMDMNEFFERLGAQKVESLDVSSYEGATIVHDLNEPVPPKHSGRYTLVYDGGTMEHVFNVPTLLQNVHTLLSDTGTILHDSPMNGWVDHGFYQFSPTFYIDYYSKNKYDVLASNMVMMDVNFFNSMGKTIPYKPGSLDRVSIVPQDRTFYNNLFVARKTENSTSGVAPTQGFYCRNFGHKT
jgi:hypothetical protein